MSLILEIQKNFCKDIIQKQDEKFKECCELHGVDVSNEEEVKRRCEVKVYEGNPVRDFLIDGKLAALFTEAKVLPFDMENPSKMKSEFHFEILPKSS